MRRARVWDTSRKRAPLSTLLPAAMLRPSPNVMSLRTVENTELGAAQGLNHTQEARPGRGIAGANGDLACHPLSLTSVDRGEARRNPAGLRGSTHRSVECL